MRFGSTTRARYVVQLREIFRPGGGAIQPRHGEGYSARRVSAPASWDRGRGRAFRGRTAE